MPGMSSNLFHLESGLLIGSSRFFEDFGSYFLKVPSELLEAREAPYVLVEFQYIAESADGFETHLKWIDNYKKEFPSAKVITWLSGSIAALERYKELFRRVDLVVGDIEAHLISTLQTWKIEFFRVENPAFPLGDLLVPYCNVTENGGHSQHSTGGMGAPQDRGVNPLKANSTRGGHALYSAWMFNNWPSIQNEFEEQSIGSEVSTTRKYAAAEDAFDEFLRSSRLQVLVRALQTIGIQARKVRFGIFCDANFFSSITQHGVELVRLGSFDDSLGSETGIAAECDFVAWMDANLVYGPSFLRNLAISCIHNGVAKAVAVGEGLESLPELARSVFSCAPNSRNNKTVVAKNQLKVEVYCQMLTAAPEGYQVGERPMLSIIIPLFNNGKFLIGKCIPSIQVDPSFGDFEILLIDDGSDDLYTEQLCNFLSSKYENIKSFSFADGGSGTASRARNKGIELSEAGYLTFLDPDNVVSPSGYSSLLEIADTEKRKGTSASLVAGFQKKVSTNDDGSTVVSEFGKFSWAKEAECLPAGSSFLIKHRFPVLSTQAAIIDRTYLIQSEIRFVEGAIGQDTLFGWQLLAGLDSFYCTDSCYIVYFSDRDGSVTNSTSVTTFERSLVRELSQIEWLVNEHLLFSFIKLRLPKYLKYFYFPRLLESNSQERPKAVSIVLRILSNYLFAVIKSLVRGRRS